MFSSNKVNIVCLSTPLIKPCGKRKEYEHSQMALTQTQDRGKSRRLVAAAKTE